MVCEILSTSNSSIYSWDMPKGRVDAYFMKNQLRFTLEPVDDPVRKIVFSNFISSCSVESKARIHCENCFPKLVEISDGSLRISLQPRGLGGMVQDQANLLQKNNTDMANTIKQKLPIGTYTSINVSTITHQFPLANNRINTRKIQLQVTQVHLMTSFFHAFFSGFGLLPDQAYEENIDESVLQRQLIGTIFQNQNDWSEIEKAYKKCTTVSLFIAQDCSAAEIQISNSTAVLFSSGLGKLAKGLLPLVMPMVPMLTNNT